ncbi:MAG: hypothetical protein H6683_06565 [Deltaproteobacteria bacterium]|nr:hypothetical protein [Deltaproteobacteria bacterium]
MLLMLIRPEFPLLPPHPVRWGRQAPAPSVKRLYRWPVELAGAQGNLIYACSFIVVLFVRLPGCDADRRRPGLRAHPRPAARVLATILGFERDVSSTAGAFPPKCQSRLDDGYLAAAADAIGSGFLWTWPGRFFYFSARPVSWDLAGSADNVKPVTTWPEYRRRHAAIICIVLSSPVQNHHLPMTTSLTRQRSSSLSLLRVVAAKSRHAPPAGNFMRGRRMDSARVQIRRRLLRIPLHDSFRE